VYTFSPESFYVWEFLAISSKQEEHIGSGCVQWNRPRTMLAAPGISLPVSSSPALSVNAVSRGEADEYRCSLTLYMGEKARMPSPTCRTLVYSGAASVASALLSGSARQPRFDNAGDIFAPTMPAYTATDVVIPKAN
jgi:hypothetical protein